MGKRNSMLNTELGRKRYYEYQRAYRKEHTTSYTIRFNDSQSKDAIDAINALPSMGVARNTYLRNAIIAALKKDGYVE